MAVSIPTNLLRTFVTVTDLGSYTKAGDALGRTQPAISLQIRRLEELLGAKLIRHDGKSLLLTEAGDQLVGYARQILHLNDQATSLFHRDEMAGVLKVGLPIDFAVSNLQKAVVGFINDNPEVELELYCELSSKLIEALHADEINMAVALIAEDRLQYLVRAWEEKPIWVMAKGSKLYNKSPLPLVGHPEGCEYRKRMTESLTQAKREWRIAYTSPDISGVQQAIAADLGVTALTRATYTDQMQILTEKYGLPDVEKIRVGLFYKQPRQTKAAIELSNCLIASLDAETDSYFTQSSHP